VGTLRTIFALSVVLAHTWPYGPVFVGSRNAVQLFYIISGYLISYVLVERKSYRTIGAFYLNRYLRLYPIYLFVAGASLLALLVTRQATFLDVYKSAPTSAVVLLCFSNVFLFGQDWVLFSAVQHGTLMFSVNFQHSEVVLYRGLVVPQAWTLGVELSFYLIAPFVLANRRLLLWFLIASIATRCVLFYIGLGAFDPWTYRFFPAEFALFAAGALAQQVLAPWYRARLGAQLPWMSWWATGILIILALVYSFVPVPEGAKMPFLFLSFLALIPFTFVFQQQFALDAWIGNLSYPIYIGHMLVFECLHYFFAKAGIADARLLAVACVGGSVAFALGLNGFIGEPMEALRSKFRRTVRNAPFERHPAET
jgi:peptidoglycan/LPS O-acetylase OafA/YrhL